MASDDPAGTRPAPVVLRIKLRYDDVDAMTERFASYVGRSGLFLPTRSLQPIGTEVKFELRLSTDQPVLVGLGRVKHVQEPDPANPRATFGIGVELMRVTRESRELILKLLARRRQLGLADVALPRAEEIDAARRDAEAAAAGGGAAAPRQAIEPAAAKSQPIPQPIEAVPSMPVEAMRSAPTAVPQAVEVVASAPTAVPQAVEVVASAPEAAPQADEAAPLPSAPSPSALQDSPLAARPTGPVSIPKVAAIAPLPPEPPRRPRRSVSELIESASGPVAAHVSIPDLDEDVDVGRALARARALASGDLDQELDLLRDQAAAPLSEISIDEVSAELARQLGGVAVRRDRRQGWAPPPAAVSAAAAPVVAAEPPEPQAMSAAAAADAPAVAPAEPAESLESEPAEPSESERAEPSEPQPAPAPVVAEAPAVAAEPSDAQPAPAAAAADAPAAAAEPAPVAAKAAEPAPVVAEPAAESAKSAVPLSVRLRRRRTIVGPVAEPVAAEPAPVASAPIAAEPAPAASEPVAAVAERAPVAAEPAPASAEPASPPTAAHDAPLDAGVIERAEEDRAHLRRSRRRLFERAKAEPSAAEPQSTMAPAALPERAPAEASSPTPDPERTQIARPIEPVDTDDSERTQIGSMPEDPRTLDKPVPTAGDEIARPSGPGRIFGAGLKHVIPTVPAHPELEARPPDEVAPPEPPPLQPVQAQAEEAEIEEIEEIEEFEILAEADAADADLLTSHGEAELAAAAAAAPPGEPDFASRLDLGDDDGGDFYQPLAGAAAGAGSVHERAPLTLDPRELSAGQALAALEGADEPSGIHQPPAPSPARARRGSQGHDAGERLDLERELDSRRAGLSSRHQFDDSDVLGVPPALRRESAPDPDFDIENALGALDVNLDDLSRSRAPGAQPRAGSRPGHVTGRPASRPGSASSPPPAEPVRQTGAARVVRQTGAAPVVRSEPEPPSPHNEPTRVVRPATGAPPGRNPRLHSEDGILINFDDDDDE